MIAFRPLPTDRVRDLQNGGADAHGMAPERAVSDGSGNPCRHCLRQIPEGAGMLILAWRPFPAAQPYAETGPIFLCADPCAAWQADGLPPALDSPRYLLRGYDARDRISYGTGRVVPTGELADAAESLFDDPAISYAHLRSASNNCFQCRIERA